MFLDGIMQRGQSSVMTQACNILVSAEIVSKGGLRFSFSHFSGQCLHPVLHVDYISLHTNKVNKLYAIIVAAYA